MAKELDAYRQAQGEMKASYEIESEEGINFTLNYTKDNTKHHV